MERESGIGTRMQICKKRDAITFLGYRDGRAVFCLKTRKHVCKRMTLEGNIVTVDGEKRYSLTLDQLERFRNTEQAFQKDYAAALRGEGFMRVGRDGEVRYIRRNSQYLFTFLEVHADGSIRWRNTSVAAYLSRVDDDLSCDTLFMHKLDLYSAKKEEELLLLSGDEYIAREIRYLRGEATEADVKALEQADGKIRFFRKKEVYGPEDIELISFQKQAQSPLRPSLRYDLIVKIDGRSYRAYYRWKEPVINTYSEGGTSAVHITPKLFECIRARTGGDKYERFKYPEEYRNGKPANFVSDKVQFTRDYTG